MVLLLEGQPWCWIVSWYYCWKAKFGVESFCGIIVWRPTLVSKSLLLSWICLRCGVHAAPFVILSYVRALRASTSIVSKRRTKFAETICWIDVLGDRPSNLSAQTCKFVNKQYWRFDVFLCFRESNGEHYIFLFMFMRLARGHFWELAWDVQTPSGCFGKAPELVVAVASVRFLLRL